MKHFTKIVALILFSFSGLALSQVPAIKNKILGLQNQFQALPKAERIEFVKFKMKASQASSKQKFFSCMIAISDARNIFKDDIELIWLEGICSAQIQDVDAAIGYYNEVLKINPHHLPSLMNLVEINFFAGRHAETVKHIEFVNALLDSKGNDHLPLLDFKYLIAINKLAKLDPVKYNETRQQLMKRYSYMDDHPYHYYAHALQEFDLGNKQEGLIWILKAYLIFKNSELIEVWNKTLIETNYIGAHEIMFRLVERKNPLKQ